MRLSHTGLLKSEGLFYEEKNLWINYLALTLNTMHTIYQCRQVQYLNAVNLFLIPKRPQSVMYVIYDNTS